MPEVTGQDRPLQFLDGRGHAGEALAELCDGKAFLLQASVDGRRVPPIDRDFLH
ncbi:MAG: hypothetical protein WAK69_19400 [Rhodoplanes sp.]